MVSVATGFLTLVHLTAMIRKSAPSSERNCRLSTQRQFLVLWKYVSFQIFGYTDFVPNGFHLGPRGPKSTHLVAEIHTVPPEIGTDGPDRMEENARSCVSLIPIDYHHFQVLGASKDLKVLGARCQDWNPATRHFLQALQSRKNSSSPWLHDASAQNRGFHSGMHLKPLVMKVIISFTQKIHKDVFFEFLCTIRNLETSKPSTTEILWPPSFHILCIAFSENSVPQNWSVFIAFPTEKKTTINENYTPMFFSTQADIIFMVEKLEQFYAIIPFVHNLPIQKPWTSEHPIPLVGNVSLCRMAGESPTAPLPSGNG